MFTRRLFVPCALCAVTGFIGSEAHAQTNQQSGTPAGNPGFTRRMLQQADGPAAGMSRCWWRWTSSRTR
jgi:hypothetical protein